MSEDSRPIVCVGFAEWESELWTNQQHLMARLAQDRSVLFIESLGLRRPQLAGRDLARMARRLIRGLAGPRERDGVLVLSPLVLPYHSNRLVRSVNARLLPFLVRRAAKRAGIEAPVLWGYVPQAESLVRPLRPHTVVYHCVDDIAEQKGIDAESFRAAEARYVAQADLVLASAPALADRLRPAARRLVYAPNVADTDLFAEALLPGEVDAGIGSLPAPRIVFTGAIVGTKLDMSLIADLARARPEWSIALVGPVGVGDPSTDIRPLVALPNVHLLGARTYVQLPSVLRGADAAVIPYAINDLTRSIFPMKVYEYLAAGVPVVSTPLPALADAEGDIAFGATAEEFVDAIDRALESDSHQRRVERSDLARSHSWDARVADIRALLTSTEATKRTIVGTAFTPTLDSGRGVRTCGVVTALAAHGPVDLVFQATGDGRVAPDLLTNPQIHLHPVRSSRGLRRMLAYGRAWATWAPQSFAKGIWPELPDAVRALDDGRCRIVADGPIAAAALRSLGRGRVVYNSHNIESSFRHLLDRSVRRRLARLRTFEKKLLKRSAESWVVSAADQRRAAVLAPRARLRLVPNVVDLPVLGPPPERRERSVVFVGDFGYEPNVRAARFLIDDIAPALWAVAPDVRILIVGRGSDGQAAKDPRIHLAGYVDDLGELYGRVGCAAVPLLQGGGSPLKFVAALAHGVPVVATPVAAQGLEQLRPGQDFLLADATGQAFARAIARALDPAVAQHLGTRGRAAVERHYSTTALTRELASW